MRSLFLPLRCSRVLYYLRQLQKNQWRSPDYLQELQNTRLQKMVRHAYDHVPYYRRLFDSEGITPDDIRSAQDLIKIPVLTKDDIRNNYPKEIIARGTDIDKSGVSSTTGTTGQKLHIVYDNQALDYSSALAYYAFLESGVKARDKMADICIPSYKLPWWRKRGLFRKEQISIREPMNEVVEQLANYKPDIIYSFPSYLQLLAQEIQKTAKRDVQPRLIITQGETLTENMRTTIQDVFQTEVRDSYGSVEFMRLAFECKTGEGYHYMSDSVIVECIKDGIPVAPGEVGEIVITGLYNHAMPLIRYKLGDMGIIANHKCSCGRNYPLIQKIEGRTDDFFITPKGRLISPRVLNASIKKVSGLGQYKIVQEAKDRVVIHLVPDQVYDEQTNKGLIQTLDRLFSDEPCKTEIKIVQAIPRERTGKTRMIVSEVV